MKHPAPMVVILALLGACGAPRAPGQVPTDQPTAAVRINVVNFTTSPGGFTFRMNGKVVLDTIARGGSLNAPVLSLTLHLPPGRHRVQFLDKRSQRMNEAFVETGPEAERSYATVELIFEGEGMSRITVCHCVRLYGGGAQTFALPLKSFFTTEVTEVTEVTE